MSDPVTRWRAPRLWRAAQWLARLLVALLGRLRVTGEVPAGEAGGPLILAANHISPFDPVVLTAACQTRRIAPRFLATGGLFRAPVLGAVMRRCGHIPVHRGSATVADSLEAARAALAAGAVILVYPEGRIGLDPEMWPQRGKTGVARLALSTGVPVVPVAQWGAHEAVPYSAPRGLARALPGTLRRRPALLVRFGEPVDLRDLTAAGGGHPRQATDRIVAAIRATLAPLRADQPERPRHLDPTRPVQPVRSGEQPATPEV